MGSGAHVAPFEGQEFEMVVTGMCRVVSNSDGSTETARAVDDFERWQLGSDVFLDTVDEQLQWCSWCTMLRSNM